MKIKITMFIMSILFALILCGVVSAADTNKTNASWSQFQSSANHTSQSNYTGPQTNTTQWKFTIKGASNMNTQNNVVVGADGTIYFGTSGSQDKNLYAVNPNGTLKWKYNPTTYQVTAVAIDANGTIYFGTASGGKSIYAVTDDGTSAVPKWNFTAGGNIRGITIGSDGTIYFTSQQDFKVYALYANGTQKWNFTAGGTIYSSPAIGTDGTIYFGCNDGYIYALYPTNGTQKWKYQCSLTQSSPAIGADGTIYIGVSSGTFYALTDNGNEATVKWKYSVGSIQSQTSPAIGSDGTIYIGGGSTIYALIYNGIDVIQKWAFSTSGNVYGSPVIGADGTIYIGAGKTLYALYSTNGTNKWNFTDSSIGNIYSLAIGANGAIYITNSGTTSNTNLYAIKDPAPVANFTATPNTGNSPLNVQFNDTSINTPNSWFWNFGDGKTSTEQNPTHTYNKPGTYTVTLTAVNAAGNSTQTLTITAIDVTAPTVNVNVNGGLFNTTKTVILTTTDDSGDATTYYTTDGSDPTTSSKKYTGAITINSTTTLKYMAVDAAGNKSPVYTQTYTIDKTAPTANANVKSGLYNTNKTVKLSMSKKGTIYYTLNGSTPTTNSKKYTGAFTITSTTTLKYIAVDAAGNKSPIYTVKYTIDKKAPNVSSSSPKVSATGVSKTKIITVKFNEKILKSVNWSKVYMKNLTTGKLVSINKWIKGNILYIKMTHKRYPHNWYKIYIPKSTIKDNANNKLTSAYKLTFKT